MKVLILNGSPRFNGNTKAALKIITESIIENSKHDKVELIDIAKYNISGCTGCSSCKKNKKTCIIEDDGNFLVEKIYEADVIIFGSPVYWWGITSQLKALIDRIYCKNLGRDKLKKKIGLIMVGAADTSDIEYQLISTQFKCICEYLSWELVIDKSISAYNTGDLEKDTNTIKKLKVLWKNI